MPFVITRTSPDGERIIASGVPQDEIQARIIDEAVEAQLGRDVWPDTPNDEHVHPIRALTAFSHIDDPPFPRTEKIIPGYLHTVREVPPTGVARAIIEHAGNSVLDELAACQAKLDELFADHDVSSGLVTEMVTDISRAARHQLAQVEKQLRSLGGELADETSDHIPPPVRSDARSVVVERLSRARVSLFVQRSSVSWGYVDLTYSEPLVSAAETPTLLFALIALDKTHRGHGLVRENHHSGYHFHYAHASTRRSDVLLTFGKIPPDPDNPVTWERHGEGHAAFSPDVSGWGLRKRESLNRVCCANAEKLGRAAFRSAGRDARFLLPV